MSASVTSSAAPWFTNGLAVSDFGYGNETMRLSGPHVGDLATRVRASRDHAYGLAAATAVEPRPQTRRDSACASARLTPSCARNACS